MQNKYNIKTFVLLFILFTGISQAQLAFNPDTVKSHKYDTGKMWAFEFPPLDYFKQIYGFDVNQGWFDDVRLSALRIPGCSASFVSEDGLVMTNNHCARGLRRLVQKEGEDLSKTAFMASTLEEERKIPNYSAEQLVYIKEVTSEVQAEINKGKTEKEKISLRDAKIKELKESHEKETKLKCDIISYFNGSIFFVQGFRVFNDVRLVFQPEEAIAYFGGDPDNFTYPRYNLDCTFLRIYDEDGKPFKSTNYYKWNTEGAKANELVFTVGNPGTTNRLRTVAQLEHMRDIQFNNISFLADNLYQLLADLKVSDPKNAEEYERLRLAFSNSQKSISNTFKALNNPYLIARKKDFESKVKAFVNADSKLKKEYGQIWETISKSKNNLKEIDRTLAAYSTNQTYSSRYLLIASALVFEAKQKQLAEDKRDPNFTNERYRDFVKNIYPKNFYHTLEEAKLALNLEYMEMNLGKNNPELKKLLNGRSYKETAKELINSSLFKDEAAVKALFEKTPEEILALNDPLVKFFVQKYDNLEELKKKQKDLLDQENVAFNLLGQVLYKMYGTSISPDANRTLRISDGLMKGYNYNGTIAPVKTTFYGLLDRYYGFEGQYPYNLSERWQNIPEDFNLNTPFNFVATNDIIGGNSGSAIINKNAEVIGLAFDGNIESLEGNFIYLPDLNRTVGVDSKGMYEAIKRVYKLTRLSDELQNGKIN